MTITPDPDRESLLPRRRLFRRSAGAQGPPAFLRRFCFLPRPPPSANAADIEPPQSSFDAGTAAEPKRWSKGPARLFGGCWTRKGRSRGHCPDPVAAALSAAVVPAEPDDLVELVDAGPQGEQGKEREEMVEDGKEKVQNGNEVVVVEALADSAVMLGNGKESMMGLRRPLGKCGSSREAERLANSVSSEAEELCLHNIEVTRVHANMLAWQGLITSRDKEDILNGLNHIERLIMDGKFEWRDDRGDVYMNIAAALVDLVGEPAKKLQVSRSQNDHVATDLRLWCRDAIDKILMRIKQLQVALVMLAMEPDNKGLIVPGYTHMQRTHPVLVQHLLLSYVEQLERDADRLISCKDRLNYCPLGACDLAGTGLPINSVDAVLDRDFVLEFLSANSITAIHLTRLGEKWVLWASPMFEFLTPKGSTSTRSSISPNNKNPKWMELVRGKSSRVVGDLASLLTLCKGLSQAYSCDLQEHKEPLFDSVKTILEMLEVSTMFAINISFNREKIRDSLQASHLDATTLADYLLSKGIPLPTTHEIVGKCVAMCAAKKCRFSELALDDLQQVNPVFGEDVYGFVGVENTIKKFSSYGSTDPQQVEKQLEHWVVRLREGHQEEHIGQSNESSNIENGQE